MTGPWPLRDAVRLAQGHVLAVAALTACWYGSASTTRLGTQALLASAGVAAVGCAALTNAFWLLVGLRAVRDRRVSLHRAITSLPPEPATAATPVGLVVVDGGTLLHEAGCPAVQGKPMRSATAQRRRALRPCPMCGPA